MVGGNYTSHRLDVIVFVPSPWGEGRVRGHIADRVEYPHPSPLPEGEGAAKTSIYAVLW